MRTPTNSMLKYLQQRRSSEPILVIGVDWNGIEVFYSDTDIAGASTRIIASGDIYDMLKVVGSGGAKSMSITLEDSGGDLKNLLDTVDFHMRNCNIYLVFDGLSLDDKLLMFSGSISTPIDWNASTRSLTFNVLSDIKALDAGFIMEEGKFPKLPDDVETEWPMVFGAVCGVKPVLVRSPLQGILAEEEGISDPSLPIRLCQAKEIQCPVVQVATVNSDSNTTLKNPTTSTTGAYWWHQSEPVQVPLYAPDATCVKRRYDEICGLLEDIEEQATYEHNTITVYGGNEFPTGRITIVIGDGELSGSFSGNTFTIKDRKHPEYDELTDQECVNIPGEQLSFENIPRTISSGNDPYNHVTDPNSWQNSNWYWSFREQFWDKQQEMKDEYLKTHVSVELPNDYACDNSDMEQELTISGGSAASWEAYQNLKSGSMYLMRAGEKVFVKGDETCIYVVSIIPGTVTSVSAYKLDKETNKKTLVAIPSDYYYVTSANFGDFTATEVAVTRKLSDIDETWEDDIRVSFVSSVGPNPVDIIQWLVQKYSSYTIDSVTFAQVKNYLRNYPSNFVLKGKHDLFSLISDIAYQARCELRLHGNTLYIYYLSVEPSPVMTINNSLVYMDSLEFSITNSDDLVTKYVAKWSAYESPLTEDGDEDTERECIVKHNINKYGLHTEEYDYYTLSNYECVLKTATFWLIRYANSWKKVSLTGPPLLLLLEVKDCVWLNLPDFSPNPIRAIVEDSQFDPKENSVTLEFWTPVKCGTSEEYYWTWPATKPANAVFPLPGEDAGTSSSVPTPPAGHLLYVATDTSKYVSSYGDPHPSDIGDTFPTSTCFISNTILSPREMWQLAMDTANASYVRSLTPRIPNILAYQEALARLGPAPSPGTPIAGFPFTFTITAGTIIPTSVSVNGVTTSNGVGMPVDGITGTSTRYFINEAAAQTYRTSALQEVSRLYSDGGQFTAGTVSPTSVGDVQTITNSAITGYSTEDTFAYYPGEVTQPS